MKKTVARQFDEEITVCDFEGCEKKVETYNPFAFRPMYFGSMFYEEAEAKYDKDYCKEHKEIIKQETILKCKHKWVDARKYNWDKEKGKKPHSYLFMSNDRNKITYKMKCSKKCGVDRKTFKVKLTDVWEKIKDDFVEVKE